MNINWPFLFMLCFFASVSQAQEQKILDSLFASTNGSIKDSITTRDIQLSFFDYVYGNPEIGKAIAERGIKEANISQWPYAQSRFLVLRGIYHDVKGNIDSAIADYNYAMDIGKKSNDTQIQASIYNNLGLISWNSERFDKAIDYYLKAQNIFEKLGFTRGLGNTSNNIGLLYLETNNYNKALDFFKQSIGYRHYDKDSVGLAANFSNISKTFGLLKQRDSSLFYLNESISLKIATNDIRGLSIDYNNLGAILESENKIDSALVYLKKAEKINEEIKAQNLKKGNLKGIGSIYLVHKNDPKTALSYFERALNSFEKDSTALDTKYQLYQEMGNAYDQSGNYKYAALFRKKASFLRDTIIKKNQKIVTKEILEKYESEKKEKEILSQRAQLAEKELEVRKKNYIALGLGGGALLLALLGYLFYNQQRLKNKQQAKEFELEKALVKIETQNKLQEQRLRISRDLHDNIGSQLTFITSSIDNLKYGMKERQKTTKNKLTEIGAFTKNTINELRDTIWAMNKESITFEDLEDRLANLMDQARNAAPQAKFVLDIHENIDRSQALTSVEGMNLYRIIQEAVNNAIKYADAQTIEIALSRKQNRLNVTIKDDGKGFDTTNHQLGNGLTNMRKRAKDIEARYSINSKVSEGTTISLEIDS